MGSVLEVLDREWGELAASPRARRALIRWVNINPDLAGFRDLDEVLASRRDHQRAEPTQRALAELAAGGDDVAARTLLKAVTPGLVALAARCGNDDEAAIEEIMALAWERIRTYPCHRAGRVAANIVLDVRKRQLRDPLLLDRVAGSLATHGLPGDALCLELTESLLMEDPVAAAAILHKLRDLGARLSIDDFGTGYSSLSYLKRFPVDHVKIDRSFVECLDAPNTSEESLVAAIIAMASALGMTTVAEGVEIVEQSERLRLLRADRAVVGHVFIADRH